MARERQPWRAPPPTPIATGKGLRSAAVDERVLAEYLESSLRVPELTLPDSCFPPSGRPSLRGAAVEVGLAPLLACEDAAVRRVVDAAARGGAVRVRGEGGVAAEEVRAAVEAGRRELDGPAELCWHRPESEASLAEALAESSSRPFRDKMEKIASKLEMVAECIAQILSENIQNQKHREAIGKTESVLCLRKIGHHRHTEDHHSHALTLYISSDDHEHFIRVPEGSSSFALPAGSILVALREPLQEWSKGEYKCSAFEEPYDDSDSLYILEFMCSPLALDREHGDVTRIVSILDQMFILITLIVLYNICTWVYSIFTKT